MPRQTLVNRQTGERFAFAHPTREISKSQAYQLLRRHGKPSQALQLPDGTGILRQSMPNPQQAQQLQARFQQVYEQITQQLQSGYAHGTKVIQALDAVLAAVDSLGDDQPGTQQYMTDATALLQRLSTSRDLMLGIGTDGVPIGTPEAQIVYALAHDPVYVRAMRTQGRLGEANPMPAIRRIWRDTATQNDLNRAVGLTTGQPVNLAQQALQMWAQGIVGVVQAYAQAEFIPEVLQPVAQMVQGVARAGMPMVAQMAYKTPAQTRTGQDQQRLVLPQGMNRQALRAL